MPKGDFADEIRRKLANDPALAEGVAKERLHFQIAEQIFAAREAAGLTQAQLADLANTTQSVIARVEDADYDGHSTKLLNRIANAMGLVLRVEFYDPRIAITTNVVEEITDVIATQVPVPWVSPTQSTEWKNPKVSVTLSGLASVA